MPDDYDDDEGRVGYGRPPKHTQFKKGQSGNPNGRRRKHLSERDIVEAELRKYVFVTEKWAPGQADQARVHDAKSD